MSKPSPSRHFWQFGLKTLFFMVALVGLFVWAASSLSASWTVFLGWVGLLVAGHVLGNAIGTHAKSRSPEPSDPPPRYTRAVEAPPAAATRLRGQMGLGRIMWVAMSLGAAAGAAAGCWLLWRFAPHTRWYGLVMGSTATGVIGGLFGFLTSSLLQVGGAALLDAADEPAAQSAIPRPKSAWAVRQSQ